MGGGLLMVGGEAFGARRLAGSEVEKILPVDMDIPAQRPGEGMALIMHSCEMPDGNYWGIQCAHQGRRDPLPRRTRLASSATGWKA